MPVRVIYVPAIHIIVEDADELTEEVRERIEEWMALPEYEPNPNGDAIRCEAMHLSGPFEATEEDDMECVEGRPHAFFGHLVMWESEVLPHAEVTP